MTTVTGWGEEVPPAFIFKAHTISADVDCVHILKLIRDVLQIGANSQLPPVT